MAKTKIEEDIKEIKIEKKEVKDDDDVYVINNTYGGLTYINPVTGRNWSFSNYGSKHKMKVHDLITMQTTYPIFMEKAWIVIENNKDVVDYLGLTDNYKYIIFPNEIDSFFKKSANEIKEFLKKTPESMKKTIASKAKEMIKNGKLDSMSVKYAIEEVIGYNLN